jgi:hypothetical protein
MATPKNDDFPGFEIEGIEDAAPNSVSPKAEDKLEIIDDTPLEDRDRQPMPKEIVEELENDELDQYEGKVKLRLKQMKKVWHDERREREKIARQNDEAVQVTQRLMEENRRLKQTLSSGEETLLGTYKEAAELELAQARRAYKDAYDAGDADLLVEAQEKLGLAANKVDQLKRYKPTLQVEESPVDKQVPAGSTPVLDPKTKAWQERNTWWGVDPEMTASALGLHQKLETDHGKAFVGSEDYWQRIDATMQRRFPEYFGDTPATQKSKPAQVVAPASRSTPPKKVVLTQSQVALAKKLGVTPEQYARELVKIGN